MLYAKLDNRQVKIQADDKEAFLKKGYTILEVVKNKKKVVARPENVKGLKKEVIDLRKKVVALEKELKELRPKKK